MFKTSGKIQRQHRLFHDGGNVTLVEAKTCRRFLIVNLGLILVLNVFFVVTGAVLAGTIAYRWRDGLNSRPAEWYGMDSEVKRRFQLFFFYCTVPIFMTAVSVYDAVSISRDIVQPVWLLISAITGTLLSIQQGMLEGSCIFGFRDKMSGGAYCPFALAGWHPEPSWGTGLALAWYMPWIIIASMVLYICYLALAIVAIRRQSAASGQLRGVQRSYWYSGVPEEAHEDDISVGGLSTSRRPSYEPSTVFHKGLPEEKRNEMV